MSRAPRPAAPPRRPSARARAAVLEYAVARLASPGASREDLCSLLQRLAAAFGAQAALVLAPGSAQPLGQAAAYPAAILDDLVLLAQIRCEWAAHGGQATASGRAFHAELDSGGRRAALLVVPAIPAPGSSPCALALVGDDLTRWQDSARTTLKAVATLIARLPLTRPEASGHGAAGPAYMAAGPAYMAAGPAYMAAAAPQEAGPASRDALAKALVAGAPDAIVAVDSSRRILEFNPAAERLFGRRRGDLLGQDMPELLVPERLRPLFVQAMAAYLATGDRTEFPGPVELRALCADGGERPILLTPMPVTVDDATYFFGFMRDTTELDDATAAVAEGDARFRLLSDLAPVGIVQTDADGTCRFVNDKWCELTGLSAGEVIGTNWRDTINPDDVARIDATRDQSGAPTELATDCRLRTASGRETWVHAVVRRVIDGEGRLVGRVAALTDVDIRKSAEAAKDQDRRRLVEQNVELRDLDETRLRYLATVSHELRTPLTSIVSFAELIRAESTGLGPEPGEYLDIVQRNAERLLRLVGDLLDLQGLEEGAARLELAPVSVPRVARDSVRSGWAIAAVDGIKLDITAQEGPDVQADGGRLQQVLDNLISNAVKFSDTGGSVRVRATHDAREWRIDVADAGIGIPPSEVDHLFDRFFRASNARRSAVPGTGLGLPTAKVITELHGGRIEVASQPGSGTTFTVYLPIAR